MVERLFVGLWTRYRPREGWLPLLLLTGIVATVIAAVLEAEWVPEVGVVGPAAFIGLGMGVVLAKRPLRAPIAWFFIIAYGLLLNVFLLGQLRPPWAVISSGWTGISQYWRQSGALLWDRMFSWFTAAFRAEFSQETIVFAFGLGLLAWFLTSYAAWSTYRQQRPLVGLSLMGMALAVNSYYGAAQIWWASMFVALAVLLAAAMHFVYLQQQWQANGVDFSDEIRFDLLLYAGAVAMSLLFIALTLPTFRLSNAARALLNNPAVTETEAAMERIFAGVRQPRRGIAGVGVDGFVSGAGMPRAYLLGDPPELYETVVMTAAVKQATGPLVGADAMLRTHWRGLSYDIYTGNGWARSEEREQALAAGAAIPYPDIQSQAAISQSVSWAGGERQVRYTLGMPLRFSQPVDTLWRGLSDLVWVRGTGEKYEAVSQLNVIDAEALRQTAVADVPAAILARYTSLPPTVPVRVHELAQEITTPYTNPYDQARAIERFLRQYTYSLELDLPPEGIDPVDFFLFEQQAGYCDYYASAMTVLARAIGLPARTGVGFLSQLPDENGIQTIYQINGHSWSEIYFAGYGWVEFEPTAAFPSAHEVSAASVAEAPGEEGEAINLPGGETPPIPEADRQRPFFWKWAGLGSLLVIGMWAWLRRRQPDLVQDRVLWAYGRMQDQALTLGYPAPASLTPDEFKVGLLAQLDTLAVHPRLMKLIASMRPAVEQLTQSFIARQYSQQKRGPTAAAVDSWRRLRPSFWLLRMTNFVWRLTRRSEQEAPD